MSGGALVEEGQTSQIWPCRLAAPSLMQKIEPVENEEGKCCGSESTGGVRREMDGAATITTGYGEMKERCRGRSWPARKGRRGGSKEAVRTDLKLLLLRAKVCVFRPTITQSKATGEVSRQGNGFEAPHALAFGTWEAEPYRRKGSEFTHGRLATAEWERRRGIEQEARRGEARRGQRVC